MDEGVTIRTSVDSAAVVAMLMRAPAQLKARLNQVIEGSAIDIQRELRLVAPIAVTGNLRQSVRYTYTPSTLTASVEPTVEYAQDVESGSKPRYVSVAEGTPLRAWADLKGLNPYAVRNAIAKRGTQPHPYVKPTYDKMKPVVEEDIAAGIAAVVEELNNGVL